VGEFSAIRRIAITGAVFVLMSSTACASDGIRSDYKSGEIKQICDAQIKLAKSRLDVIAQLGPKQRRLESTVLTYEYTNAELGDAIQPVLFMKQVSTDPKIRAEAAECEQAVSDFGVETGSRRDLYNALRDQKGTNPDQKRLVMRTLQGFERNGLKLSDEKLAKVKELNTRLTKLQNDYETNLINDTTTVSFSIDELKGLSADLLST
jgi:thimet oligopeptidase